MPTLSYTSRLGVFLALVLASCGPGSVGGPGGPSSLRALSLTRQAGSADQVVTSAPTVMVTDPSGAPLAGVQVEFEVTAGGGTATPSTAKSTAGGQVQAAWRLGASGVQQLRARLPATGQTVLFSAEILGAGGGYHVDLRLLSSATDTQEAAFTSAATRIERVVVGGLPSVDVTGRSCEGTPLSGNVQGLLILVELERIDGRGGILGEAGPCLVRSSGLAAVGIMRFDTDDLAALEESGRLVSTILHEMLHIVGVGFWDPPLLAGAGTTDSSFTGANALAAAIGFDGAPSTWTSVPVESCAPPARSGCGPGTRDSHWRESVFRDELMTGWLSGTTQPLSRTTIASLADLGYTVDLDAADPFDLGLASLLSSDPASEALPLGDDILRLPLEIVP